MFLIQKRELGCQFIKKRRNKLQPSECFISISCEFVIKNKRNNSNILSKIIKLMNNRVSKVRKRRIILKTPG